MLYTADNIVVLWLLYHYRIINLGIYGTDSRFTALIYIKTTGRIVMKFRIGGSALNVVRRI